MFDMCRCLCAEHCGFPLLPFYDDLQGHVSCIGLCLREITQFTGAESCIEGKGSNGKVSRSLGRVTVEGCKQLNSLISTEGILDLARSAFEFCR